MYLTKDIRSEYRIVWVRCSSRGRLCWRSNLPRYYRIVRERVRIGNPVYRWTFSWCAYYRGRPFFTTSRLQRAFRVASRDAQVQGLL